MKVSASQNIRFQDKGERTIQTDQEVCQQECQKEAQVEEADAAVHPATVVIKPGHAPALCRNALSFAVNLQCLYP